MKYKELTNEDIFTILDKMKFDDAIKILAVFRYLNKTESITETIEKFRDFMNLYLGLCVNITNLIKDTGIDKFVEQYQKTKGDYLYEKNGEASVRFY